MLEEEFKIMLTKEQYEKLLKLYDFREITQTNHYYDTSEIGEPEMSARHITVRVRELDGKFYLQMKLPTEVAYARKELSEELDCLPEEIGGARLSKLSGEECPDVRRLGSLKTTRNIFGFDGGEIDLDKSEYFGKTDYELEIEFTDKSAAEKILGEIKSALNITQTENVCEGKVRRFLNEYKNRRENL